MASSVVTFTFIPEPGALWQVYSSVTLRSGGDTTIFVAALLVINTKCFGSWIYLIKEA